MPSLTIRLVVDRATGKKDVLIDYASDEDALPMEHEDAHKRLVDSLIAGGTLKAAELGKIVVTREGEAVPEAAPAQQEGERQAEKVKG